MGGDESGTAFFDHAREQDNLLGDRNLDEYTDRTQIANEIAYSRRLCGKYGWPLIDVTRKSVEETAATIISLLHARERRQRGEEETGDG